MFHDAKNKMQQRVAEKLVDAVAKEDWEQKAAALAQKLSPQQLEKVKKMAANSNLGVDAEEIQQFIDQAQNQDDDEEVEETKT